MTLKEKTILPLIRTARQLFRNTWVHRLKITSRVYKKVFQFVYRDQDVDATFRGIKLHLPTKDTSMVPSIINQDYEKVELDIFESLLGKSGTVLDIGANLGIYSIIASNTIGTKGRVFAFEPIKENISYLEKNLVRNKCKNVELVQKGVGRKSGKLKIYLADKNVGTHSAGHKSDRFEEVRITSVDDFVKSKKIKVDLIKIDIEGYEGFAMEGAKQTIEKFHPVIFMEFSGKLLKKCGYDPDKLLALLSKRYKYVFQINERSEKISRVIDTAKIPRNSNQNLIFANSNIQ